MKQINELKSEVAEDIKGWYDYAKKYFDLLVRNDPAKKKQLSDAIAVYEKNNEIK